MKKGFNIFRAFRGEGINRRRKFLRNLIALLIIIIVVVLVMTVSILTGARKERITAVMQKRMDQVLNDFRTPLDTAEHNNKLITRWCKSGVIDLLDETGELDSSLIPLLEDSPYLDLLFISNNKELHYCLNRSGDTWWGNKTESGRIEDILREFGIDPTPLVKSWLKPELQDSTRIKNNEEHWFLTKSEENNKQRLLLVNSGIFEPDETSIDGIDLVISGIDIGNLISVISKEGFGGGGRLEVITDLRKMKPAGLQDNTSVRSEGIIDSIRQNNDVFDLALKQWMNTVDNEGPYLFRYANRNWWGLVTSFELRSASFIFLAIQPEDDILQEMNRERYLYGLVGVIIILVSLIVILIGIRGYKRIPGEVTDDELTNELDLEKILSEGESETVEFKSSLRWNLKTGKTDREIELAVMKNVVAFLNTEGGLLLVGVEDNGAVIGIEKDGFSSNDKFLLHCNNLIKKHIGLEFANQIYFRLTDFQGKQVLIIRCERSADPVFLKHEEEEDFYIRVGPGSRKLSTRKAIKYISARKEDQKS